MMTLNLVSAGAAQGLVESLRARFAADTGATVSGRFGAVGAMKELLLGGAPCDLMITTEAMVDALVTDGWLRGDARAPLGWVRTGVAVPRGEGAPEPPDVSTPEALRAALLAADEIYFPDPQRATAGIHFAEVMKKLGVHETLRPRFRTYPNGATAMREMGARRAPRLIGCTQVTEILYTESVALVAPLPAELELVTVYSAAVSVRAAAPQVAQALLALLTAPAQQQFREAAGFEG